MRTDYDVIVVGGGMAGAHAAYPLVQAGLRVALIDGGIVSDAAIHEHAGDFETVRKDDEHQHELFLGEDLSGIIAESHASSITAGSRKHVSEKTTEYLPLDSGDVDIVQSLAKGGLSEAWGAVCAVMNNDDLRSIGIPLEEMPDSYRQVMQRIGVSGTEESYPTQQPTILDGHANRILKKYASSNSAFVKSWIVRQPLLAVLTESLGKRRPIGYRDLEYVANEEDAIYRARFTIEELEQKENFTYLPNRVLEKLVQSDGRHAVVVRTFAGEAESYTADRIILAAGAFNTTRILLQSFGIKEPVSLLVKENVIIACIDPHALGQTDRNRRHSLCQLTLENPQTEESLSESFSHIYSYRSLLLFRLAQRIPFPAPQAFALLSMWAPSFVLCDTRFPVLHANVSGVLSENGQLVLEKISPEHSKKTELSETKRILRKSGLIPVSTQKQPLGASVHYAGGVPFKEEKGVDRSPLSVDSRGELLQSKGIYVADSATWRTLPAKPPGLTIMANANRVANHVLRDLLKVRS